MAETLRAAPCLISYQMWEVRPDWSLFDYGDCRTSWSAIDFEQRTKAEQLTDILVLQLVAQTAELTLMLHRSSPDSGVLELFEDAFMDTVALGRVSYMLNERGVHNLTKSSTVSRPLFSTTGAS